MSEEFFDTLLWVRLYMAVEKYNPNRVRFFVRKKYTIFSSERIVALRSVNKIFPESYDFAANSHSVWLLSLNHYWPVSRKLMWSSVWEGVIAFIFRTFE
jgi:hypothetical protein